MSYYYFHPLGENCQGVSPFSYYSSIYGPHGNGKLDFSIGEVPFYAMVTGKIVFCGTYNDGTLAIIQECTDSNLGSTFYIRYLHGINNSKLLNKTVKQGTQLGIVSNNNGKYENHLHVDFSSKYTEFSPIYGTLNESERTWTYNGKTFNLLEDCDLSKVSKWAAQNDNASTSNYKSGTYKTPGYCWLVFASKLTYLTASSSSAGFNEVAKAAQQVAIEYYKAAKELGCPLDGNSPQFYSQSKYVTATIDGTKIHSRRDCSGYVSGVWQLLGDVDYNKNYSTSEMIKNGYPSNWEKYKMSDIGIDNLQMGDVIVVNNGNYHHAELFIKYDSSGNLLTYGMGYDQKLGAQGGGGNPSKIGTSPPLSSYQYVLRRN